MIGQTWIWRFRYRAVIATGVRGTLFRRLTNRPKYSTGEGFIVINGCRPNPNGAGQICGGGVAYQRRSDWISNNLRFNQWRFMNIGSLSSWMKISSIQTISFAPEGQAH